MDTIKYLSAQEISESWGITKRRVQNLCVNDRIPGAIRIGNMWAIPSNAEKPKDARYREHIEKSIPIESSMRKARRQLKTIVDSSIRKLQQEGLTSVESLHCLIVLFASSLLDTYIDNKNACLDVCKCFFKYDKKVSVSNELNSCITQFINDNKPCLDDSLSWVYQFGSKKSDDFKYKDTQFFTEKYMINTLVDSIELNNESIVIDPACGGGNFLLYSFDILAENVAEGNAVDRATYALSKLYGYEIEAFLAYVASFNLKFKALSYLANEIRVTIKDFESLQPRVYRPINDTISGFLDINWLEQSVENCNSGKVFKLIDAFDGANVVVTNPPFRTIKGMPPEQKNYLQENYPMSKCDMCNAFIERVLTVLPNNGKAAMVTQNSWMYLDSFATFRKKILSEYTINNIWELGSNAFYDLSGEKANVSLTTFTKSKPEMEYEMKLRLLRNISIEHIERALYNNTIKPILVKQCEILNNPESRFDLVSTKHLKSIQMNCTRYKDFAIPMQGTSTGDAKNLIDYYWKHLGDKDWVLVSKGGGYSRFEGLNSYCVKWGEDGEYIKNTKGSAIRNANYFNQTQLVFSDTGTAGLNVRVLLPGQIFVASGPGIRITKGKKLAHLAFLNSRFAAFFVRLVSPKLTIAAGYIGQIPVTEDILNSTIMENSASKCLSAKLRRLSKRPNNIEFNYIKHDNNRTISDVSRTWFMEDIEDEWTQLINEQKIEDKIAAELKLSHEDEQAIDNYIGVRNIFNTGYDKNDVIITNDDIIGILGFDCFPKRTKASKKSLGSDGIIEYLSQLKGVSCERIYSELSEKYSVISGNYIDLYLHALILSGVKYRENSISKIKVETLFAEAGINDKDNIDFALEWIENRFNIVHNGSFEGNPLYKYCLTDNSLVRLEE
ncbi:MAG: N-6 DNA methylase [Ruminococcus sp.]|uniref:HsdM family class I SAM-dependent methyltransferase n=1 Tax=Ruminococcus sp. TaxID=41978 RepID=UPI00345C5916|nr:N-6 DNA methylase [Ruminococcus sp.]